MADITLPIPISIVEERGDSWIWTIRNIVFIDGSGRTLYSSGVLPVSTVKRYAKQAEPTNANPLVDAALGVAQVNTTDRSDVQYGFVEVLSATSLRVVYQATLTELFPCTRMFGDVVLNLSPYEQQSLYKIEIDCEADITRSRAA